MPRPDDAQPNRRRRSHEESSCGGVSVAGRRDRVAGRVGFRLLKRRDGGGERSGDGRLRRIAAGASDLRGFGRLLAQPTGRHADGGLHKQRAQVRRLHDPAIAPRVEQLDPDQGETLAEEIIELTQRPGEDITILRSGALVRSLLRGDLLDELRLMVHPVVLGTGKQLFGDGSDRKSLELVDSKTFGTGVLYLTYQPPQS